MGSKLLQTLQADGIHTAGREPISQSSASPSLSCGLGSSREMEMGLLLDVNSLNLLESREGKGQRKAIFSWEQIIFLEVLLQSIQNTSSREKNWFTNPVSCCVLLQ